MSNFKMVVFDIAGTTVRDKGNIAEAFISAFNQYGMEVPVEEVNKVMGWRKKDAIVKLIEQFQLGNHENNLETVEHIHDSFIENMVAFYEKDVDLQPLPFAEEIFQTLKSSGVKVALNTGFTTEITEVILRKLNWKEGQMIDYVISSNEVPEGRPFPFMIKTLMSRAGIADASFVVKVGDTEVDVQEGRNAACGLVVAVTTGAYNRAALEQYKPDYILDQLEDLLPLVV